MPPGCAWAAFCLAAGLTACEPEVEVHEASFELQSLPGCELGSAESLALRALGDFPAYHEALDSSAPIATFDHFPLETRELAVDGRFASFEVAGGRAILSAADGGELRPMLVLPEGRSCPLGDRFVAATEGAAVSALPSGGLLIAGGVDSDGKIASTAVILAAGHTLGEQVEGGMVLRRQYASAVLVGTRILVSGGTSDPDGSATETYEVFDTQRGTFDRELIDHLKGPRMEHGSALLPDGSVLLAGGREGPMGAPLATTELISAAQPTPDPPGNLVEARVAPSLLVLDSGAVIVAGGRDAEGAAVPALERFEAAAKRFVRLETSLPRYEEAVAVALPGARIAWLGCDTRGSKGCGLTLVLLRDAEPVQIEVTLDWKAYVPDGLTGMRAVALDDGRILVIGREPTAGMTSRALVVDVGAPSLVAYQATRTPNALVALADGVLAELDAFGTSFRRLGSASIYDTAEGDLLDGEVPRMAIDAPDRWERSADSLRALVSGARADLTRLRFGDFQLELELSGDALLRLAAPGAPELAIGVGSRISAPGCQPLTAARPVRVERRAGAITIHASPSSDETCVVAWPDAGLAQLAIEAEVDTTIDYLGVTRL